MCQKLKCNSRARDTRQHGARQAFGYVGLSRSGDAVTNNSEYAYDMYVFPIADCIQTANCQLQIANCIPSILDLCRVSEALSDIAPFVGVLTPSVANSHDCLQHAILVVAMYTTLPIGIKVTIPSAVQCPYSVLCSMFEPLHAYNTDPTTLLSTVILAAWCR